MLLPALPEEFPGLQRVGPSAPRGHRRSADPVRGMASKAPARTVYALGRRDQKGQPGCRVLSQWIRPDSGKRLGTDSLRGPPEPLPQPAALAKWKIREGCPLHVRHEADRGIVRCHGGFAVPVDGFRAESERGPGLRGGRHRTGLSPLGDQVQCQAARPALAQAGGGPLRLALEERKIHAQRAPPGPRRAGVRSTGARGPHVRFLPCPGGGADSLRDGSRYPARCGSRAAVQSPGAAEYRQSVRRAMRAVEGLRGQGRRTGGHPRDFAQRRAGQAPSRFRPGRPVRRIVCRQRDRTPAERLSESRRPRPSPSGWLGECRPDRPRRDARGDSRARRDFAHRS